MPHATHCPIIMTILKQKSHQHEQCDSNQIIICMTNVIIWRGTCYADFFLADAWALWIESNWIWIFHLIRNGFIKYAICVAGLLMFSDQDKYSSIFLVDFNWTLINMTEVVIFICKYSNGNAKMNAIEYNFKSAIISLYLDKCVSESTRWIIDNLNLSISCEFTKLHC